MLLPSLKLYLKSAPYFLLQLWQYNEGITTHVGNGHSAVVTAISFSPNGKYIVSTSASGSIFVWECPFDVSENTKDTKSAENKTGPKSHKSDKKKQTKKKEVSTDNSEHVSELGSARDDELSDQCRCRD